MTHLRRLFFVLLAYLMRLLEVDFRAFTVEVCLEGVYMVQSCEFLLGRSWKDGLFPVCRTCIKRFYRDVVKGKVFLRRCKG